MHRAGIAVLPIVLALATSTRALAAPPKRIAIDGPCTGCRASLPADDEPAPLLVVLHGDWGHGPKGLLSAWERHAAPRGVAVLALACPKDLGCKGSFWRWYGDASFIFDQVKALRGKHAVDERRIWIAGWSGGATYIGMRSQELEASFAALVFHGGGYPPTTAECAEPKAPTYFLAGDRNPLHAHVRQLREHYDACGNEVVWNVVRGADHDGEWTALEKHGGAVVDWLLAKRMHEAKPAAPEMPASSRPPADAPPKPAASASPGPRPTQTVPPRTGCGCTAVPTKAATGACAAVLVILALRRRERRVVR